MVTKRNYALVLGASSGLGLASAKTLANDGYSIIAVHRDTRARLAEVEHEFGLMRSAGSEVLAMNFDATNPAIIDSKTQLIREHCGATSVKAVIHSIAMGSLKPMTGENALGNEDFLITINAMAVSLYSWVSALKNAGLFTPDARIISFTSEGSTRPMKNYAAVSAAKAALEAITRSIALEFASDGIKCNCIQAGVTDTSSLKLIPAHDRILEISKQRNPNGRVTTPEDIAKVVSALCSDNMQWVSGSIIKADGGESLQ